MICRVRTAKKRSNSVLQGTKKRDSLSMRCATPSSTAWPSQAKFGVHAALITCYGCRLAAGLHLHQKLPMISEQVHQPTIRYHADCKRTPDCIVSSARHLSGRLCPEKLVGMLSSEPWPEGLPLAGDLKAQAVAYRRQYGHDPEEICADKIYRKRSNRAFCQRYGIRLSNPYLGWPMNDPE